MEKQSLPKLWIAIALVFITASSIWAYDSAKVRHKARYYYIEGARRQASGQQAEAFELYKKAYETDPSYEDAASAYGITRLSVRTDSLQSLPMLREAMSLMGKYVEKYPGDVNEGRQYAFVAGRLDSVSEAIRIYRRLDSIYPADNVNLLLLADAYMAAHRSREAMETLNRFELREGVSPQLALKKISFLLADADTVGALREADVLISTNPHDPDFHILKGQLFELTGDKDSTLACYRNAELLDPENGRAKLSLATVYKAMGDSATYDAKVYEALLSEDFEIEEKLSLLSDYLQTLLDDKVDTSRGDHLFSVLQTQFPHDPRVHDLAARYNAAKGDFPAAVEEMSYAVDLEPGSGDFWGRLMRLQIAAEKPADAMASFRRASSQIIIDDAMRLMYASAAVQAKDYPEAESAYGEMLKSIDPLLNPSDTIAPRAVLERIDYEGLQKANQVFTMLGDLYQLSEQPDKAICAYETAMAYIPSNPLTLNNYAYFLAEADKNLDKALEMSTDAITSEPDNDTYLDTHAWVLFKRKEYKEALEYQEKALEMAKNAGEPDSAEFFSHLGDILFMNHRPYEALANWKKALEITPDDELLKKKVKHKTFFFE